MGAVIQAHAERAHAILSASGSKRWLTCTPSAQLEQQFPNEETDYAAEGTFAHEMADLHLKVFLEQIKQHAFAKELKKLAANDFYSLDMLQYIENYRDIVAERINAARARTKDAMVFIEQRLDFSTWVPDGYGTGDVVIIADDFMEVIDLKYGKGVPVSAVENTQMRLYGLGAIHEFGFLYDIKTVRMTIVQPRLDSISEDEMTVDDLLGWAESTVRGAAQKAMQGEGEFEPGDHCRFCRARHTCRARAEANLELMVHEFKEPPLLTLEELAQIRGKIDGLVSWAGDVKDHMLEQAEKHGVKYPGWKLVEGRSNRIYSDKEKVEQSLLDAIALEQFGPEFKSEAIYEPKELLGITKMEKAIGKKPFTELLSDLIVKPTGKPTLVEESDKRPELSSLASIESEFGNMGDE